MGVPGLSADGHSNGHPNGAIERDTQRVPPVVALPQIAVLEREAVAGA